MKALSIRQPWCHHIFHDGKDVENRDWRTSFRGTVLIHASLSIEEDREFIRQHNLPLGGIVGVVDIVDCVSMSDSRWFVGKFGFVLCNPRPIELIPCPGKLGFFDVPAHVAQLVEASLS